MKNLFLGVGMAVTLAFAGSCEKKDDVIEDLFEDPDTEGLLYVNSDFSHGTVYNDIISDLNAKEAISIVAEVDHEANASSVNQSLRNTSLILFGNPALGTPIMQNNQLAGLDLPQKILVYDDENENTIAAYNDVGYLENRYNVEGVETLEKMKTTLADIVTAAAGEDLDGNDVEVDFLEGIIIKESKNNFTTTYDEIINALNDNAKISIIAELDHQANAASVGESLNPTSLIIFGNPELGTPLMLNAQTTAIDLPQKILVYENDEGEVKIAYNDPQYIADRHDIDENEETIDAISNALDALTDAGVE